MYLIVDFIIKYIIIDNLSQTTRIIFFSTTNSNFIATIKETLIEELV